MTNLLFEQHQTILKAANELLRAVQRSPRPAMDELSRLRMRLSSEIRHHRHSEEELVFAPLKTQGGFEKLPQAKIAYAEIQQEKNCYSANIALWTPQRIMADWNGYRLSLQERINKLHLMIRKEEDQVYRPIWALVGTPGQPAAA